MAEDGLRTMTTLHSGVRLHGQGSRQDAGQGGARAAGDEDDDD
jgi:hypothetical protein